MLGWRNRGPGGGLRCGLQRVPQGAALRQAILGHVISLQTGGVTQAAIAKDIQFHPVTDEAVHFDLYRVSEHQLIRISVPVHFFNHEASPGLKRGGTLNVAVHEVELMVPADQIPEELTADLTGLDIGDAVRSGDLPLPKGAELSAHDRDVVVASIATSSAMQSVEAGEAEETPEA